MSPNCVASSALSTSEAEILLCCFDAATSCALEEWPMFVVAGNQKEIVQTLRRYNWQTQSIPSVMQGQSLSGVWHYREARFRQSIFQYFLYIRSVPKNDRPTADRAIRVTRLLGKSYASIPSELASCCACAVGAVVDSFRGIYNGFWIQNLQ